MDSCLHPDLNNYLKYQSWQYQNNDIGFSVECEHVPPDLTALSVTSMCVPVDRAGRSAVAGRGGLTKATL